MSGDPEKAWFEHHRDGPRLKAKPIHRNGWIALAALIAFPLIMVAWVSNAYVGVGAGPFLITLIGSLALVWVAALYLLRTRSRPRG